MVGPTGNEPAGQPPSVEVFIVAPGIKPAPELLAALNLEGVAYGHASAPKDNPKPAAVVYDLTEADRRVAEGLSTVSVGLRAPTIAVVAPELLVAPGLRLATDEMIVFPWHPGELALRLHRVIDAATPDSAPGVIQAGDLVIDTNRYDVFLAGRPVLLTFKEYELLKLLASNPGRVYRREALLEQVWGYAYFGGTRTVDVHVRRLRSKIDDAQHTFIDTVWNVGYRFSG